jgi:hypothetical protein
MEIFSLCVSFLAVIASFAGLGISYNLAKFQASSSSRQKWTDELIALLSEYISECEGLIILGKDGMLNTNRLDETLFKRILYLDSKINLMLNPKVSSHTELINIIKTISEDVHHGVTNLLDFGGRIKGVTDVSRKIIANEREKISGKCVN